MIEAVISLLHEGYSYVSEEKARKLYIYSEFKRMDREVAFLGNLRFKKCSIHPDYHLSLQKYILFELLKVKDVVARYGDEDEKEAMRFRSENLNRAYKNYFYKTTKLFVVK